MLKPWDRENDMFEKKEVRLCNCKRVIGERMLQDEAGEVILGDNEELCRAYEDFGFQGQKENYSKQGCGMI